MEREKEKTGGGGDRDRYNIKETKKEGEKEEKRGVKQRGGGRMVSSQWGSNPDFTTLGHRTLACCFIPVDLGFLIWMMGLKMPLARCCFMDGSTVQEDVWHLVNSENGSPK